MGNVLSKFVLVKQIKKTKTKTKTTKTKTNEAKKVD